MMDTGRSRRRLPQLHNAAGYSLVEMIVAVGIAAIVGMGLYSVFNSQRKFATSQKIQIDLQTSCGMAMDQMKQELLLAGYRGEETPDKTFSAEPFGGSAVNHKTGDATGKIFDKITFEYFDDKAKFNQPSLAAAGRHDPGLPFGTNYTESTKIRYELSGGNLVRRYARFEDMSDSYASAAPQILASGVQSLEFELFTDTGQLLHPVSVASLENIRSVGIKLTCRAPQADKLTGHTPTITLTASVKPRNVGLEANPRDTTAPSAPLNVKVWDPGVCGELRMRWDANTDADLAGYTVLYGLAPGVYSHRARISRQPGDPGDYEEFPLTGLTPTKYTDAVQATYYIAVTAYDKSSNQSPYSDPETFGLGVPPSARTFAATSTGSDTTISLDPAPAPANFNATGGAENQINLSWDAATVTGLVGYRLYRGTDASFDPDDTETTGNLLADQSVLGPTVHNWTDPGTDSHGPLKGCTRYFYKLAAIHCDATIPIAGLNFATADSEPTDTTAPPSPILKARPGFRRILLSLVNPSEAAAPDFEETKIWYGRSGYPSIACVTAPESCTPIPDMQPWDATGITNTHGTFRGFSSRPTINFNNEGTGLLTDGNPAESDPLLVPDATYYFIAVSFDKCGKNSAITSSAKAEGAQCNDCLGAIPASEGNPATAAEVCYDAPPPPENLSAEGCTGPLKISWLYPYLDQTDVYRDLTGFHVFRCEGTLCPEGASTEVELTKADGALKGEPTWATFWEDSTAVEGKEYTYRIQATDCYYERRAYGFQPGDDTSNLLTDNYADEKIPESGTTGLYTGRLIREYRPIDVTTTVSTALGASDTTVNVCSTVGFVGGGNTIKIEDELIKFTGTTATSFTGCTRGYGGTTAAAHAGGVCTGTGDAGMIVYRYPPPPAWGASTGGLGQTPPDLRHNQVSIALRNTAGSLLTPPANTRTLSFNHLTAGWENTTAYLKSIVVGDNDTTDVEISFTEDPTLTKGNTAGTIPIVSTPIDGADTMVPMSLTFAHASGSVDAESNMREDNLNLGLSWWNDSTQMQCPTPTVTPTLVSVPLGPMVSDVTMDLPTAGTVAYQVPGGGATANTMDIVKVPGGVKVNVFANVYDTSLAGIKQVRLYYYIDSDRVYNASHVPPVPPVDATATFPALTPYTRVFMEYVAGSQWRTPVGGEIPVSDNSSVWFFIVATDNHDNFDREPELDNGAFQYYQQEVEVCKSIPNPPGLAGVATTSGVQLTITKPTNNTLATGGGPYNDHVGYKVFRKLNNGAFAQVGANIVTAVSPYTWPSATTYDAPTNFNVVGNDYTYYVVAYDACLPANPSGASAIYMECVEASPCSITLTPSDSPFHAGGSFEIEASVCSLGANTTSGDRIWLQTCSGTGDADPILLVENGLTGIFRVAGTDYSGRTSVKTYLDADYPTTSPSPIALDLKLPATTNTIWVSGYGTGSTAPAGWDDTCQNPQPSPVPDPFPTPTAPMLCHASLAVAGDCVTPSAPRSLAATYTANNCSSGANDVKLTWLAPTTGTATFYRVYRCNAAATAEGANCTPGNLIADNVTGLTYTDLLKTNLGSTSAKYWYTVKAVDGTCASDGVSGPATKADGTTTKDDDKCGSN